MIGIRRSPAAASCSAPIDECEHASTDHAVVPTASLPHHATTFFYHQRFFSGDCREVDPRPSTLDPCRHIGDTVDLDSQPNSRQRSSLDRRPRGAMLTENARIDAIHLLELLHVEQKYSAPQHVLHVGSGGSQDGPNILQTLLGLRRCVCSGQLSGGWIGRSLPRNEDESLETHPGRVRTDGFRKIGVVDWSMAHSDFGSKV